jgi:hypothetical protein
MNKPKLIKREQVLKQEQTALPSSDAANAKSVKSTVSEWVRNQRAREVNSRAQFAALFTNRKLSEPG